MGSEAHQLAINLFRYKASTTFAQSGTHTSSNAMSKAKHRKPSSLRRKYNLREMDLAFDTHPRTRREPTSSSSL